MYAHNIQHIHIIMYMIVYTVAMSVHIHTYKKLCFKSSNLPQTSHIYIVCSIVRIGCSYVHTEICSNQLCFVKLKTLRLDNIHNMLCVIDVIGLGILSAVYYYVYK